MNEAIKYTPFMLNSCWLIKIWLLVEEEVNESEREVFIKKKREQTLGLTYVNPLFLMGSVTHSLSVVFS